MATLIFGLGYIGSALAAELQREGHAVVGMDNAFATDWPALERLADGSGGSFRLLRGDIRTASDVDAAFTAARASGTGVEAVYLLAAQASAHAAAAPAEYTEETNLRGPRLVYEGALCHGSPPVVYGSSFHIYGPQPQGEIDEARPYGPLRDLAHLSKVYAEKLGEMYATTRGLTVAPVRLGIVYGLGPVMKRDLRFVTVPHAFCLRVLAGEPLPIHPGGRAPLPFIHLEDAVSALRLAGAAPAPPSIQRYAPANAVGEVASVLDVARLVQRAAWDAGRDAVLRFHTPEGVRTVEGGRTAEGVHTPEGGRTPEGVGSAPAVEPSFAVRSRLDGAGWRPVGRLATALPAIMSHYALPGSAGAVLDAS